MLLLKQSKRVLIPLYGNEVAPRFDLATEAMIAEADESGKNRKENIVVLTKSSAEQLCQLILAEKVDAVICSGIEDEHYQYLKWKRVLVIDSVIGLWRKALDRYFGQTLKQGDILK
ncbi:MAG: dinitrogenase iron-molybdenum cofactor biosynthesis protein [Desulfobacteraceae bacterium]|nr:dinitrogenase iron-molybdenum cofactor biosynthesis protein [Desulfobacteraceae bacterium]